MIKLQVLRLHLLTVKHMLHVWRLLGLCTQKPLDISWIRSDQRVQEKAENADKSMVQVQRDKSLSVPTPTSSLRLHTNMEINN